MSFIENVYKLEKKYKYIYFDFDGVIKDSVGVKSSAFEQLFSPFGSEVSKKVRRHHESHGGMSRYDKLPIYLLFAGQDLSDNVLKEYSESFSRLVKQRVIDSEWVPGVLEYLYKQCDKYTFFLVTATPQLEIEEILASLDIQRFFDRVTGAPTKKGDAIKSILEDFSIKPENSVMIGDSDSDYKAALVNDVPFILRRTELNKKLQEQLDCPMIIDFK